MSDEPEKPDDAATPASESTGAESPAAGAGAGEASTAGENGTADAAATGGSDTATGAPAEHQAAPKPSKRAFALKLVASIVGVAVVSAAAIVGIAYADIAGGANKPVDIDTLPATAPASGSPAPAVTETPPPLAAVSGGFNMLLVGTDTRTGQGAQFDNAADQGASSGAGNNDVTMLIQVSADHRSARVVSFPRDLVINIPDCGSWGPGQAMMNTTLRAGLGCPVKTIEQLTGVSDIQYAAAISFKGVAEMSRAVGGVHVCVATAIDDPYTGLHLKAGTRNILGGTALKFLRTRHGVGDGSDLGRISNQELFMAQLVKTMTSKQVLDNPARLYSIAKTASQTMSFSTSVAKPLTLVQLALALKSIPLSRIAFVQYPTVGDPADPGRVIPAASASVLDAALKANRAVKLTGGTGRGTQIAAKQAPIGGPKAPDPTVSPIALPADVTGQTAAQSTCSKGQQG